MTKLLEFQLQHEPFAVVQLISCVQLFVTPSTAALQASLSYTISQSLFKLMSIDSVMPPNNVILCHPLLLLTSPLIQGKEQWLHFAGAAVKRYPMPKIRETQVRW